MHASSGPSIQRLITRTRRAFTLVEVLIAVATVALLGVAMAYVFETTGRTLTQGKRLSDFNARANMLAAQMKLDFDRMTRSGFLVIHNEWAGKDKDANIPVYSGDPNPRPRRIDQIMFFSEGQFASSREPLAPGFVPRGEAARIWYGHGTRAVENVTNNSPYLRPNLDDQNRVPETYYLGESNTGGNSNPNRYASDWILMRHATVLVPPRTSDSVLSTTPIFGIQPKSAALLDSDKQIMIQPAASGIFRSLASIFPNGVENKIRKELHPQFSSGLVDVSTTTLPEIRSVVMTADVFPNDAKADFFDEDQNNNSDGQNVGVDGIYRRFSDDDDPMDEDIIKRQHSWMSDALPAYSTPLDWNQRTRMRCEPSPTNYLGTFKTGQPIEQAYRRGDQLMLSASNFALHCTEFIVEWSFGKRYPDNYTVTNLQKQLIWHGLTRVVPNGQTDEFFATPYDPNRELSDAPSNQPPEMLYTQRYRKISGDLSNPRGVPLLLIHGEPKFVDDQIKNGQLTSYFGYVDPTFNPDVAGNDGKLEDPDDANSPTLPWAWPKLIRITMTVVDAEDPSIEQTLQWIYETPGDPQP